MVRDHLSSVNPTEANVSGKVHASLLRDLVEARELRRMVSSSPLKKSPVAGFQLTTKHKAAKAVSPPFETMGTI